MNIETLEIFKAYKIVFGSKIEYVNGQPSKTTMLWPKYEKRGNYHYVGGKRVSRNVAAFLARKGAVS